MNTGFKDNILLIITVYRTLLRLPRTVILRVIINPVDITRYAEFICLLKFMSKEKLQQLNILDVSSPFIMSYILSMFNKVTKSDVNIAEKVFIAESSSLNFANENALSLSFNDRSFDLVYSISVVEHIYQDYMHAINEMIRVTQKGGLVYLTFPVSWEHTEEWLDENIYSNQYKRSGKTFFQYRFDEKDVNGIFNNMRDVEIISKEIFWERKNGEYDRAVAKLKHKYKNRYLDIIKDAILSIYYGFTLLDRKPGDFSVNRSFGNMSVMIRKL